MNTFSGIANKIIDFIYPPYCGVCGKALSASGQAGACEACIRQIKRHPKPDCLGAGASFTAARSACLYEGALKELIHLFKYKNKRALAGLFSQYMLAFINDEASFVNGIELVTFVPLHRIRLRKRDFNQSEALGRQIAAKLGLPATDCLEKIRHTANQNELSRLARLGNLKGAFRARERQAPLLRDRAILLVDDVMTTGATFDECSRTLLTAGAREVRCLALARGI